MLKRLAPFISVLICVLLDTALIPSLYYGRFLLTLTLVAVINIGIQLGRTRGMLYGMIGGLILDITTGSLGLKLFAFTAIGFLIGFLLDQQGEIGRAVERRERLRRTIVRAVWVFLLVAVYELVMLFYQYFSTAVFEWVYVGNLLARTLAVTALCLILAPLFHRVYLGRANSSGGSRSSREVKNF